MSDKSLGRLALVGLLALLVVDALLVALAFRPGSAEASAPASTPVPAATSTAKPSATAAPTDTATQARPLTEAIAAVDGQRAWRALLGTCAQGGSALTVTDDGGKTWTKRSAGAAALGRVQPVAATRGFVIGAPKSCSAGEYATDDDGRTWRGPRTIDGGWSRVPGGDQPALVITPKRPDARPCGATPVIDLARVSATRAVAACADGRLVRSADGGSSWTALADVQGTVAVAARDEQGSSTVYVARVVEGCAGVEVAKVADSGASRVACVTTLLEGAEGRVSLSVVADAGWLAVADATWRSGSDLKSWSETA
ncbi:hypothetical protein GCM10009868_18090 [Terrabacter aerolatus]|uniref:Photosynthesis system II assembly factor Ycf48/Hcf136-like domain-containing protein n=2 Tax=Terrabacter aerolatus TaxID=422442 RepID=A0A512D087_9MICO|nr:hypothetical protein TAE01_14900 [Terrabacter aerolatus]